MNFVRKEWVTLKKWIPTKMMYPSTKPWEEFEFQGYQMRGPAASLAKAGASGRFSNNARRDWFRKMGAMKHDHRVTRLQWYHFMHMLNMLHIPKP